MFYWGLLLYLLSTFIYYKQAMNAQNIINSIYNPKKKSKDLVIFPKIYKQEMTPPQSKVFPSVGNRKYNQRNIFKIEDQKREKVKLHIEQQKLKEMRNKECQQLQSKIEQLIKNHQEQLTSIEQNQKSVINQIDNTKKTHYQIKLNIWELKNEIMDLNGMLLEEEEELKRLQAQVADQGEYEQVQEYEDQNQGMYLEDHQEEPNEGGQEICSMNILHSLSQEQPNFDPI